MELFTKTSTAIAAFSLTSVSALASAWLPILSLVGVIFGITASVLTIILSLRRLQISIKKIEKPGPKTK